MMHLPGMQRTAAATRRSPPRATVRLLAPALVLALSACSPAHDWREVRNPDLGFAVMLPARPARMTRAIDLDGLRVDMTMQGAQAEDVAFTVGTVALPADADEVRQKAIAAMRTAMVRNIGGTERSVRERIVPIVDAAGARIGEAAAIEVVAVGRMRDAEATMVARFVASGTRAWQCVVLGHRVDRDHAETFVESLRLIRP